MQPDFFLPSRPVWPQAVQRVGVLGIPLTLLSAVVSFVIALVTIEAAYTAAVITTVILVVTILVLGVSVVGELAHERQRQQQLRAFLETHYHEYFTPRKIDRLSMGGSLTVADNGRTRQRIWFGELTEQGQPLLSREERSGMLGRV